MPDGRSKMLLNGEAMTQRPPLRNVPRAPLEEHYHSDRRQLEQMRVVNARLLRELAAVREREAEIRKLADRDALTGLFNRRRVMELLDRSIADARRSRQAVGLLFIDLNGFKAINDEYGHAAGDKILSTVARRISARVRTADIVGRYGGDEFIVILPGAPDEAAVSRVADTIRERVALPYRMAAGDRHLTAAIGEAMFPKDAATAETLLQRADQAMYRLKARLARNTMDMGSGVSMRPARRRNDKCRPRAGGW